jgi:DNA-binding NarL/FixJ family response regulator
VTTVRTILVCVRTQTAAQTVAAAAARLGVAHAVRTAVTMVEALVRLSEAPADLVLADPALARPDTAAFTRRVLEVAPGATVVFFGSEEPQAAAAAIAAGARAVIRVDTADPVTALAKAVLLVLSDVGPADDGVAARRVLVPAQVPAGPPGTVSAAAGVSAVPAPRGGSRVPQQRTQPTRSEPQDEAALHAFWRLIEASSLGSDGARRLRELTDPVRSAVVASRAGLGAGTPVVQYLLGDFVSACYSGDGKDHWAEDSAFTQVRTLSWLLLRAGRRGEAAELWRLAAAAGEDRAADELARVQAPPRQRIEFTERELEVLQGMAAGKSNAELSRDLGVSEDTVKTRARRLFRKLGARDRAHAVAAGFRAGLIN